MIKDKLKKIAAALLIAALAVCCCACGAKTPSAPSSEPNVSSSEPSVSSSEPGEWEKAEVRWISGTEPPVELRVRSGAAYSTAPGGYDSCVFTTVDGKTVDVRIEGLDYENGFDALVGFMKSKAPEKLTVGKLSKTVIAVYNAEETEICAKLTDKRCLTVKTSDVETAAAFFSNLMIEVDGAALPTPDLNEEAEEIV